MNKIPLISLALSMIVQLAAFAQEPEKLVWKKANVDNELQKFLEKFENPHITPYAFSLSSAVWESRTIPVCWDSPPSFYKLEKEKVRSHIMNSWQANSGLRFVNWGTCVDGNKGIRITIADDGPYTLGLGSMLNGVKGGMVLNFTFQSWGRVCLASNNSRETCIKSIAIHEFGHAIGLAHEQNRHDKPGECMQLAQGPNGDSLLTPYDPASIMNYCFNIYMPDVGLSELDVKAVKILYGENR